MEEKKKAAKLWLIIAVIALIVSMVGASLVQTSGGRVDMRKVAFETNFGQMSGWMFVPKGVSAENKVPAIVTSHGMFNNRAMQDLYFVELARRGYVVFAMDMFSHGESSRVPDIGAIAAHSMNEAVMMISRLNYVDTSRIGITGHSLGGMTSNAAIAAFDNRRETPLISAVLLNSADATYQHEGQWVNIYGSRHAGIIAPIYEEFFMLDVDAAGNMTAPPDFIRNNNAQSFLYFGQDPAGRSARSAETIYRQTINGKPAIRVIYNPAIIHPWSHFSQQSTAATIGFFQEAFGAPNPIAANNQVWQWKVLFNTIGLVAIFIFLVNFIILMVFTKPFESLRAKEVVAPLKTDTKGKVWYFALMSAAALFGTLVYLPILKKTNSFAFSGEGFAQSQGFGITTWAVLCGIFGLILLAVYYFAHGKKAGFSLADRGIIIGCKPLAKTWLLAALSLTAFFGILFFADYFFKVDFRIWTVALRPFASVRLLGALFPYMLFMLVYFTVNSISATSFNYNDIGGKKWVNMLIFSAFNVFPAVILLCIQYFTFFATGWLHFGDHAAAAQGPYQIFIIWLFPFLVILSLTPVIARKIYQVTNNPYIAGIVNSVIITMMAAANTLTWLTF